MSDGSCWTSLDDVGYMVGIGVWVPPPFPHTPDAPERLRDRGRQAGRQTEKAFRRKGLFLLIKPNGAKLWRVKYWFAGKDQLLGLGSYPEISLKQAREGRQKIREQVALTGETHERTGRKCVQLRSAPNCSISSSKAAATNHLGQALPVRGYWIVE